MFDLYKPKQKGQDKQEQHVYIEDYFLYQPLPEEKPEQETEHRGFVEIDILGGRDN